MLTHTRERPHKCDVRHC